MTDDERDDLLGLEWIYFVQAVGGGLIKIGFTKHHPWYRLATLRAGSPVPLQPLGALRGDREIERHLHARFADLRRHSEWFEPAAELLEFIRFHAPAWPSDPNAFCAPDPASEREARRRLVDDLVDWALLNQWRRSRAQRDMDRFLTPEDALARVRDLRAAGLL